MSGLIEAVRKQVPPECLATRCRRGSCSVGLADVAGNPLIIDCDCDTLDMPEGKKCDFLILCNENRKIWVVPLEIKTGAFRVEDLVKQLRGGTEFIGDRLPRKGEFKFCAVLTHRDVPPGVWKKLVKRQDKIKLRNKISRIHRIKCDELLTKALKEARKEEPKKERRKK